MRLSCAKDISTFLRNLHETLYCLVCAKARATPFQTPPFGFALFYLRGVAAKSIATGQNYRGVLPFIGIQVAGLLLLALVTGVVTIIPNPLN